jgi:DNA uptake protein ComE-like DNA-binding protein
LRQRRGIFVLLGVIVLLTALFLTLHLFIQPVAVIDSDFEEEITAQLDQAQPEPQLRQFNFFPFDPNLISKEQMLQLGLSRHQSDMISKYREAGGRFYAKEDFEKIYAISEDEYALLKPYIIISQENRYQDESATAKKTILFPFDPNSADSLQLITIGLTSYQTANVLKYRRAGGIFTVKKDFGKIYGIDANTYKTLEKYILLPSVSTDEPATAKSENQLDLIEINTADTLQLRKLKGIGQVYASRIAKYREKLGGFFDKSQLLEVYGIDTTRFALFAPQVVVDKSFIRRININEATFDDLLAHPYLEFYLVKEIFNYRDAVGAFDSVAQVKNINLIYDQLYLKIAPYLTTTKTKEVH